MNLKHECIDMFRLLFDNKEIYSDYEIEENYYVELCPKGGVVIDTVIDYDECETCNNKDACKCTGRLVDLMVFVPSWAGDDDYGTYYIDFKHNQKRQGGYDGMIVQINDRKELIDFMAGVKERVDNHDYAFSCYGENINELKAYGKCFLEEVKKDFPVFSDISCDLPIVCDMEPKKDEKGNIQWEILGDMAQIKNSVTIIHIYQCWKDVESLKKTLRHEILHYVLLWKKLGHKDDEADFHYLCQIYDAGAYKEMSEVEKNTYIELLKKGAVYVNELFSKTINKDMASLAFYS